MILWVAIIFFFPFALDMFICFIYFQILILVLSHCPTLLENATSSDLLHYHIIAGILWIVYSFCITVMHNWRMLSSKMPYLVWTAESCEHIDSKNASCAQSHFVEACLPSFQYMSWILILKLKKTPKVYKYCQPEEDMLE